MRSLRGRLALAITAVLAAVLLAGGLLVARDVDHTERRGIDDRLRRTAELSRVNALAAVEQELPSGDRRLDAALAATRSSLRLSVGRSTLFAAGATLPAPPRGAPLGLSTYTADGEHYRLYVETLRDPGLGGLARMQVVSSLGGVERRLDRLRNRLFGLGALMLLVAGAGVWLGTDLLLRPLRRLRRTTSSIATDEDLSRRVEVAGPSELRGLAGAFNAMLVRLGRSADERNRALAATRRFTADAGHELRTPLTSVQATLSTIARHPEMDAAQRAELARDAVVEQRRLVELLDGLQALARGEAGPLEMAPVDLAELADACVQSAAGRHPGASVSAELPDAPVVVHGWEPGLRRVIDNLVDNAALHGGGGAVRVSVVAAGAGGPCLAVEDDGPGVPVDARTRVFEPFARLDGAGATGRGGSGLGLALVAQQARLHGAAVSIGDSQELGGARVVVRFGGAHERVGA
jgi:signal transduction histidine kinase